MWSKSPLPHFSPVLLVSGGGGVPIGSIVNRVASHILIVASDDCEIPGVGSQVITLFVNHFKKKHGEVHEMDAANMHLEYTARCSAEMTALLVR